MIRLVARPCLLSSKPPFFIYLVGSKAEKMGWGDYPPEYNRHIHGPYDPARYYGKPDTPFGQVKLIDLPAWLSRRSLNPVKWTAAMSRAYYRWCHNWVFPKKAGMACMYQFLGASIAIMYANTYNGHIRERRFKYH